jgi:ubiquinone/menaquinone biosynthesis C-methylase UbiE
MELADPAKRKAADTYNWASDHFDDEPLAFWDLAGRETVKRLDLRAGERVLDVGCGTGASALPAAEGVGPSGGVVGVDLADRLLAVARAKAAARRLTNVEFTVGDMERLEYPDASFDAVVCVFAIFFVPDMVAAARELWRLVRPGGRLAVTTWGPDLWAPAYERWRQAVRARRPDLVGAFNPWDRITTPEAVIELLRSAGIAAPYADPLNARQPLRSPEDWWTIVLGSGLRWTVEQLDPEAAEQVRRDNLGWLESQGVRDVAVNFIFAGARKPSG